MPRRPTPLAPSKLMKMAAALGFGENRQMDVTQPPRPAKSALRPDEWLSIPVCEDSAEESACKSAQDRGQFLARQDRWDELAAEVHKADSARQATEGGMPIADLLLFGARADVVLAVEHALFDGTPPKDAPILEGIAALEEVRLEFPEEPMIALLVALAHIDMGWAWRGKGWDATVPRANRAKFVAHFERASQLLEPLCGVVRNSPILAAARCALLAGVANPRLRIADDYEDLIDLDPTNHRHMRAMGNHLLPRWYGSYAQLELEARRTASRTSDIWGHGGYTWVCFDAIALDEHACAIIDPEFFIDGLRDIVKARPDQAMINLLTAYCTVTLPQGLGLSAESDQIRLPIIDCADWLIRDHLTEVHPLIWAHASEGFDNSARVRSINHFAARGRADALDAIAHQFRDDIERGLRVTFTADGPTLHSS